MYRTIDAATWSDPWFEELDPLAKLLFLYLITTGKQTNCGCFTVTLRTISYDTGLSKDQIQRCLRQMVEDNRVSWWPSENIIFVHNFYRHQRAKSSGKFAVSARNALSDFPPHVRERVTRIYPDLLPPGMPISDSRYPIDRVSVPYNEGIDTETTNITDTYTESETQQNKTEAETLIKRETERSASEEVDLDWESISPFQKGKGTQVERFLSERGREIPPPKKERRGEPLSQSWEVSADLRERAGVEGITPWVDLDSLQRSFVGYYTEGDGKGAHSLNWDYKFLEWARREKEAAQSRPARRNGAKAPISPTPTPEQTKQSYERLQKKREESGERREGHKCEYPPCHNETYHRYCGTHGVFPLFEELRPEYCENIPQPEEEEEEMF